MYDPPIIVASEQHFSIRLMVVRMQAGRRIESTPDLVRARDVLFSGMARWCAAHRVPFDWSETAGRRSKNREYRIAYQGYNRAAANPDALFDELDAEIRRLMLT